ncbi:uncharacterized protein [Drosophila pseudoobscura]|uniref:Uncharacterized protein n=1 Tax=Drosophila pseudoobscura pseudoobscura TaxID=46245 RepID=A0A6I8VJ85_DROPS|nr:uncharacterized protein LOC26534456 [Drosophila pseudoobscura]
MSSAFQKLSKVLAFCLANLLFGWYLWPMVLSDIPVWTNNEIYLNLLVYLHQLTVFWYGLLVLSECALEDLVLITLIILTDIVHISLSGAFLVHSAIGGGGDFRLSIVALLDMSLSFFCSIRWPFVVA